MKVKNIPIDLYEAIKIVEYHQQWRLGGEGDMIDPPVLTEALNIVLEAATKESQK